MTYQKEYYLKNKDKINKKHRDQYHTNKETRLQYMQEYHAEPKVKEHRAILAKEKRKDPEFRKQHAETMRKWRADNPEQAKKIWRDYYWRNHKERQQRAKKQSQKLREDIFKIIGDKCKCGYSDKQAIHFDHIHGGGLKEVKKFKSNTTMLRYYRDHPGEAKKRLQPLCACCNVIKQKQNNETVKRYNYSAQ